MAALYILVGTLYSWLQASGTYEHKTTTKIRKEIRDMTTNRLIRLVVDDLSVRLLRRLGVRRPSGELLDSKCEASTGTEATTSTIRESHHEVV